MRFSVPDNVPEITARGFDMAYAVGTVNTAFRSGIRIKSSGQDQWTDTTIRLTETEKTAPDLTAAGRWCALNFIGGNEIPNDASFAISDHKNSLCRFSCRYALPESGTVIRSHA